MKPQEILVKALRSGDYKQDTGQLAKLDQEGDLIGNCCLGVACEEYQKIYGDLRIDHRMYTRHYDGHDTNLPEKVRIWLGFMTNLGEYTGTHDEACSNLVDDNDYGVTFDEIADKIENGMVAERWRGNS